MLSTVWLSEDSALRFGIKAQWIFGIQAFRLQRNTALISWGLGKWTGVAKQPCTQGHVTFEEHNIDHYVVYKDSYNFFYKRKEIIRHRSF